MIDNTYNFIRLFCVLIILIFLSAPSFAQQIHRTSIYGEAFGPAGAYAIGLEQGIAHSGSARLGLRLGISYNQKTYFNTDVTGRILVVPMSAVVLFPLGHPVGISLALETEAGASFARFWGAQIQVSRSPGQSIGLYPHGGLALRTDLAGGRYVARAGFTLQGVRDDDFTPTVGIGIGL